MKTASVGFHCPECTKTGKQKVYTRASLSTLNRPVVTMALVGINVAVFFAGLVESGGVSTTGEFFREGALFGPLVAAGEWWRIITSGFLHVNLIHIGFNMLLLFQLGSILEPALGRLRFTAVYFVSLLCGSFGVLLLSPNSPTVGASGAVFGLMGAMFIAQRSRGIDPFASGIGGVIAINLLLTFTLPRISIGGHVGGLLGGVACAWLLYEGSRSMGVKQSLGAVVGLGVVAFAGGLLVV